MTCVCLGLELNYYNSAKVPRKTIPHYSIIVMYTTVHAHATRSIVYACNNIEVAIPLL